MFGGQWTCLVMEHIAIGPEYFLRTMFWICFMVKFPDNQTSPQKDLEKHVLTCVLINVKMLKS